MDKASPPLGQDAPSVRHHITLIKPQAFDETGLDSGVLLQEFCSPTQTLLEDFPCHVLEVNQIDFPMEGLGYLGGKGQARFQRQPGVRCYCNINVAGAGQAITDCRTEQVGDVYLWKLCQYAQNRRLHIYIHVLSSPLCAGIIEKVLENCIHTLTTSASGLGGKCGLISDNGVSY
jgi:hypothetical protein